MPKPETKNLFQLILSRSMLLELNTIDGPATGKGLIMSGNQSRSPVKRFNWGTRRTFMMAIFKHATTVPTANLQLSYIDR